MYLVETRLDLTGDLSASLGSATQRMRDLQSETNKLRDSLKAVSGDFGRSTPRLLTEGSRGSSKTRDLQDESGKVRDTMMHLAGSLSDGFTHAVEAAGSLVKTLAVGGAVAGVGAITTGVVHLNHQLENTQISLAAIYNANKVAPTVQVGMAMAAKEMEGLRKDAARLPGEFDDLRKIYMAIAQPGFNAGMDPARLRKLASETMAVGATLGMPSDQTAREMAMMLEGRVGGHNILSMRLGFMGEKAEKFRKMNMEGRVKAIDAEMVKYSPAIDLFAKSYEGISTTTTSNMKALLGITTLPLFESVKTTLSEINDWYDKNQARVETWAGEAGRAIRDAFEWGKTKALEWWPIVSDFAERAYERIASIWERVEPIVIRVGEHIKDFLKDPGSLDKIEHVLELYAAVKVGGVATDVIGTGAKVIGAGAKLAGWFGAGATAATGAAGALGMGAAEGGAITAASGQAAWLSMVGAGGSAEVATTAAAASVATAAAAAAVALAALATWTWAGVEAWKLWKQESRPGDEQARLEAGLRAIPGLAAEGREGALGGNTWSRTYSIVEDEWSEAGYRYVESIQYIDFANQEYQKNVMGLIDAHDALKASVLMAALEIEESKIWHERDRDKKDTKDDQYYSDKALGAVSSMVNHVLHDPKDKDLKRDKHPGTPSVHIDKVEIAVTANQDPNRVALVIGSVLQRMRTHRTASPDVTNYSAPRS